MIGAIPIKIMHLKEQSNIYSWMVDIVSKVCNDKTRSNGTARDSDGIVGIFKIKIMNMHSVVCNSLHSIICMFNVM